MTHPFLSSAGNFLFGAQPAHITKHYQRYLGEKPFAYGVYAALAVYFAHRLWQVWSHDSNAVAPSNMERGGERRYKQGQTPHNPEQRRGTALYKQDCSSSYQPPYAPPASKQTVDLQIERLMERASAVERKVEALEEGAENTESVLTEVKSRLSVLEENMRCSERRQEYPSYSPTTRTREIDPQEAKRDRTRRIAGIAGSLLAMTFAANWSLTPVWQVPQFFTMLALAGGEFAYYLSPANKEYRSRCQFEHAEGGLKKFCIGLLHSPAVHSFDQMIGDRLGKLAGIESDYGRDF